MRMAIVTAWSLMDIFPAALLFALQVINSRTMLILIESVSLLIADGIIACLRFTLS